MSAQTSALPRPRSHPRLRVLTVLGTRPELVKLAPVIPLLDADPRFEQVLLHTGQHYSMEMDAVFFHDLSLRAPDVALQVGSGTHGAQTGAILSGVEKALLPFRHDAYPLRRRSDVKRQP